MKMIYEKYKQLFISHRFGGVKTMNNINVDVITDE